MTNGLNLQVQSPGSPHADLGFWIQSQIIGQPMAMVEANLNGLVEAITANRFSLPRNRSNAARITEKGTGIVEIHGMLINRAPVIGSFWGLTAYEGLGEQFRRLETNDDVKNVVLDFDTPGGLVSGIVACGDALENLAKKKPVYAIAHDMMCSAGYWLGCIAQELSVTPDGDVGSIGVRAGHVSYAQALDRAGVDIRVFKAGAAKADHAFSELLSDGAAAEIKHSIDKQHERFIAHVARNRDLTEAQVRSTDARCWVGEDAVKAGLADRVETLEQLVERIERSAPRVKTRRKTKSDRNSKGGLAPASRNPLPSGAPDDEPALGRSTTTNGGRTVSDASMTDGERPDYDKIIAASLSALAASKAPPAASAQAAPAAAAAPVAAAGDAATEARTRIKSILGSEAAKASPGLAEHLAYETDLSADVCASVLAKAAADKPAEGNTQQQLGNALGREMAKPGNAAAIKPDGGTDAAQRPSLASRFEAKFKPAKKGA